MAFQEPRRCTLQTFFSSVQAWILTNSFFLL